MSASTRPFLIIYVAWHPSFSRGHKIARNLFDHFRRKLYENVSGGTGLSVLYRFEPDPDTGVPKSIDFNEGETTGVILLFDQNYINDASYMAWTRELIDRTEMAGLRARVFPVAFHAKFTKAGIIQQAIRWDQWKSMEEGARLRRLTSDLTYQFSRMLRSYLSCLQQEDEEANSLDQYLRKVQIFISHSKHDKDGERIAKKIREKILDSNGLDTFFDVHDIPSGLKFDQVILQKVRVSAVVALHTDSYSSREWCRREVIEAKLSSVPMVVANCISDADERSFPYMGNVPIVRMDPSTVDRIDHVVGRLLDEVLKDFLWRCRVMLANAHDPKDVIFLPRPPELISLTTSRIAGKTEVTFVYPDPPLGAEEQRLFEIIAPELRLRSMTEWLAEFQVQEFQ